MAVENQKIRLSMKLTNRNNGQGRHWSVSAKASKEADAAVREAMNVPRVQPYDCPVSLVITRILGPRERLWDEDSILRGNAKQILDAMVSRGWFHDDGPRWISSVVGRQDATQRGIGPCVSIDIFS